MAKALRTDLEMRRGGLAENTRVPTFGRITTETRYCRMSDHQNLATNRQHTATFDGTPAPRDIWGRLAGFSLGLGTSLFVHVLGYLPLAEIMLATGGIVYIARNLNRLTRSPIALPLFWLLLWILNAVATDIYRETELRDTIRGISRVTFLAASVAVFYLFYSHRLDRIYSFLLGTAISATLGLFVLRGAAKGLHEDTDVLDSGVDETAWQHFWSRPLSNALVFAVAVFYRQFPKSVITLLIASGATNLYLGSRGTGGSHLLIAAVCAFTRLKSAKFQEMFTSSRRTLLIVLLAISTGTGLGVVRFYAYAASSGMLGDRALQKYNKQSQSELGLFAGGRVPVLAGILAVRDSPVVGYGSWAKDDHGYYQEALREIGAEESLYVREPDERLPSHSRLLEAWTEHGVVGGLFWIGVLVFLIGCLIRGLPFHPQYGGYVSMVILSMFWGTLFSPLASRVSIGSELAFLLVLWHGAAERQRHHTS